MDRGSEDILSKGGRVLLKWSKDYLDCNELPNNSTIAQWAGLAYPKDKISQASIIRLAEEGVAEGILPSSGTDRTEFLVPFQDIEARMDCLSPLVDKNHIEAFLFEHGKLPSETALIPEWSKKRPKLIKTIFPEFADLKCTEIAVEVGAESARITARDISRTATPKQLGLAAKRKAEISPLWQLLLKFVEAHGVIDGTTRDTSIRQDSANTRKHRQTTRQHIKRLSDQLRSHLPTTDIPIPPYKESGKRWVLTVKSLKVLAGQDTYREDVRDSDFVSLEDTGLSYEDDYGPDIDSSEETTDF